jgi:hypothetical protein
MSKDTLEISQDFIVRDPHDLVALSAQPTISDSITRVLRPREVLPSVDFDNEFRVVADEI